MLYLREIHGQINFGKSVKKIQPGLKNQTTEYEYPLEGSESKRGFVYKGYMGTFCVFGSGTESRVGACDVICYDNGSCITCSY